MALIDRKQREKQTRRELILDSAPIINNFCHPTMRKFMAEAKLSSYPLNTIYLKVDAIEPFPMTTDR